MKELVGTFNQETALVGAFSVIVKTHGSFAALILAEHDTLHIGETLLGPRIARLGSSHTATITRGSAWHGQVEMESAVWQLRRPRPRPPTCTVGSRPAGRTCSPGSPGCLGCPGAWSLSLAPAAGGCRSWALSAAAAQNKKYVRWGDVAAAGAEQPSTAAHTDLGHTPS